jgi:hypothetical protein
MEKGQLSLRQIIVKFCNSDYYLRFKKQSPIAKLFQTSRENITYLNVSFYGLLGD